MGALLPHKPLLVQRRAALPSTPLQKRQTRLALNHVFKRNISSSPFRQLAWPTATPGSKRGWGAPASRKIAPIRKPARDIERSFARSQRRRGPAPSQPPRRSQSQKHALLPDKPRMARAVFSVTASSADHDTHHHQILLSSRAVPSSRFRRQKVDPVEQADDAPQANTSTPNGTTPPAPSARASLILKSYDPVSGVCLKYKTDKAAEVGRLVASLGRLARHMAALPPAAAAEGADVTMLDAGADGGAGEAGGEEKQAAVSTRTGGEGAAAKKKKKGKR